jgi:hypothetical protein
MIIDTTTLQIKGLQIAESNLRRFEKLSSTTAKPARYVFNSSDANVGYMPNLTIRMIPRALGGYYTELDIQFSAPKIFYGTNYFGVMGQDFEKLTELLENKLEYIFEGRIITKAHLYYADIKNIAYAFNFVLEQYPNPIEYLKLIPFLSIGKRYKKTKNTYYTEENEIGFCGRMYNKQMGFKIYCKGSEIINNAKSQQELETAMKIKNKQLPFKVLRIEITFQGRTPLKKYLANMTDKNAKRERNFFEVFNDSIAKRILIDAFNEIMNELDVTAIDLPIYDIDECFSICKRAGLPYNDALALIGRSVMVRQTGALQLKLIGDAHYDRRKRSLADKRLEKVLAEHPLQHFQFKQIIDECKKQLVDFRIMKPEKLAL